MFFENCYNFLSLTFCFFQIPMPLLANLSTFVKKIQKEKVVHHFGMFLVRDFVEIGRV